MHTGHPNAPVRKEASQRLATRRGVLSSTCTDELGMPSDPRVVGDDEEGRGRQHPTRLPDILGREMLRLEVCRQNPSAGTATCPAVPSSNNCPKTNSSSSRV